MKTTSARLSTQLLSVFATSILLLGCGAEKHPYRGSPGRRVPLPTYRADAEPTKEFVRAPWELWSYGRDLSGERLTSSVIVKADETLRAGDRAGAYAIYLSALGQSLSKAEREALAFRIAGIELALDKPYDALQRLSDFARSQGLTVEQVSPRVAILMGYAYGRMGEFTQSVSWFARAHEVSSGNAIEETSASALARLVSSIPTDKLDALSETWKGDIFVAAALGEERAKRATDGGVVALKRPFWADFSESSVVDVPAPVSDGTTLRKIGVILPLTGPYAELGTNVKNGIDLAIAGNAAAGDNATVVVRDSGGVAAAAIAAAEELISVEQVGAIIGPLLTEEASAVSNVARARRVPMISFSKRADFQVSESVFRIAPTSEAQINSLLRAVDILGYQTLAIVYPDDAAGREFSNVFRRLATLRGSSVVYDVSYPKDDVEALIQRAKELEKTRAEAVFFPDTLTVASQFFSSLGETARKRMHSMGLANWDNPNEMMHSATIFEGALFVSPFFRESVRPIVTQFKATFKERYGTLPDFLAAEGFDAATMTVAALAREAREQVPFVRALLGINSYEGLTGVISADERGELVPTFVIVQMLGGVLQEVAGPAPLVPRPVFSGGPAAGTSAAAIVPTPSATVTAPSETPSPSLPRAVMPFTSVAPSASPTPESTPSER